MALAHVAFSLQAGPVGDLVSGAWAVVRWFGGAAVWLLDHGILAGAAAGTAAWIAWQAHRRELDRIEERTEAADARIAGLAFVVRRTLENSLAISWMYDEGMDDHAQRRAQEIRRGFVEHEPRIEKMLAEAASASPDVASDVRKASRLFWRAADGVNVAADANLVDEPGSEHPVFDVLEDVELGEARNAAEDCVEILRRLDAPVREAG